MYKDILLAIAGIDVFPVISLVLFVLVFSVAVIRVARMDRASAEEVARLPLEDSNEHERLRPARGERVVDPFDGAQGRPELVEGRAPQRERVTALSCAERAERVEPPALGVGPQRQGEGGAPRPVRKRYPSEQDT